MGMRPVLTLAHSTGLVAFFPWWLAQEALTPMQEYRPACVRLLKFSPPGHCMTNPAFWIVLLQVGHCFWTPRQITVPAGFVAFCVQTVEDAVSLHCSAQLVEICACSAWWEK